MLPLVMTVSSTVAARIDDPAVQHTFELMRTAARRAGEISQVNFAPAALIGNSSLEDYITATAPLLVQLAGAHGHGSVDALRRLAVQLPACLGDRLVYELRGSDSDGQIDLSVHIPQRLGLQTTTSTMLQELAQRSGVWHSILHSFAPGWELDSSGQAELICGLWAE